MQQLRLEYTPNMCVTAVDVLIGGDVVRVVLTGVPELNASSPMEVLKTL